MLLAIIFRILMCSLGAHKEGRFILPTMGPFIIFICMGLVFYRRKSDSVPRWMKYLWKIYFFICILVW